MWICLNDSFMSAVQHRGDPDMLMVRARKIEHLQRVFPDRTNEIFAKKNSDYAWRINVSKAEFADLLTAEVEAIDYDNFKNSVEDKDLKQMYNEVWWSGLIMQEGKDPRGRIYGVESYYDKK